MKWRIAIHDVVLKALGLLLLTAAVLKGHELLTVPVANKDLWSWRPFLIFQVEFELILGVWLLSGLFKRLAWLASLLCFGLFCCVTVYKGLTGAASCGCFGTVHVNPWVTLAAIDLPAVLALSLSRPRLAPTLSFLRKRGSIRRILGCALRLLPSPPRLAATIVLGLAIVGLTTPILALNKPARATSTYEVLEPETWVGKELPILEYIDIGDVLSTGRWLVLFYHYDCPDCGRVIPQYKNMAYDLAGNEEFLQIALVAIPPYGQELVSQNPPWFFGRLSTTKEWFVTTPVVVLLRQGLVEVAWEGRAPANKNIIELVKQLDKPQCCAWSFPKSSDDLDSSTVTRDSVSR